MCERGRNSREGEKAWLAGPAATDAAYQVGDRSGCKRHAQLRNEAAHSYYNRSHKPNRTDGCLFVSGHPKSCGGHVCNTPLERDIHLSFAVKGLRPALDWSGSCCRGTIDGGRDDGALRFGMRAAEFCCRKTNLRGAEWFKICVTRCDSCARVQGSLQ